MFCFSLRAPDNALNCRILRDGKGCDWRRLSEAAAGKSSTAIAALGSAGHGGDDDERLGERRLVGERQVDPRAHAARRDGLELGKRAARPDQGRPARGPNDDAAVAPIDAAAKAGAERLRASLLRCVALGIAGDALVAAVGALALHGREDPVEEAVAEALDGARDAADIDEVAADAEDHGSLTRF